MSGFIVTLIIGVVLIILGISHTKGNISSLHSYHTKRVSEEDKIPFGKKIGLGTVIIGCDVIIYSIFSIVTLITNQQVYTTIGNVVLILGLVIGFIFIFYALFKYNKGIF